MRKIHNTEIEITDEADQTDLLESTKPVNWPSYAVGAAIAFGLLFSVTLYLLSRVHG